MCGSGGAGDGEVLDGEGVEEEIDKCIELLKAD